MEMKLIALQTIIIFPIIIITSAWISSLQQLFDGVCFFVITLGTFVIYEIFFYHYSEKSKKEYWKREDEIKKHDEDRADQKSQCPDTTPTRK